MSVVKLVKSIYTSTDVTALGELASGDTVDIPTGSTCGTLNGTTIPNTKTLVVTTDKLSALAATTSSELAGVISDETGSGSLVFGTAPTLGNPTVTNYVETLYGGGSVGGGTTTIDLANGTIQLFTLTAAQTFTLPAAAAGKSYMIILTGNYAPTFNAASGDTLKWANGSAPARTASAGKYDIYCFTAIDADNVLGCDGGRNY